MGQGGKEMNCNLNNSCTYTFTWIIALDLFNHDMEQILFHKLRFFF